MGLIFEVAEGGALDIDVKIEGIIRLVKISEIFSSYHLKIFVHEKLKSKIIFQAQMVKIFMWVNEKVMANTLLQPIKMESINIAFQTK